LNNLLKQKKMKKLVYVSLTVILLACLSCQKKTDTEKEKTAIEAVIEQEKDAFFARDINMMAETWAQEPSSLKVYMNDKGYTKYEGWDAISKHDQSNLQDTSFDRKAVTLSFTNFQFDIMGNSAWGLFDAHWAGISNGDTIDSYQTRIVVLKKLDGEWKFTLMAMQSINPDKQ